MPLIESCDVRKAIAFIEDLHAMGIQLRVIGAGREALARNPLAERVRVALAKHRSEYAADRG